MDMRDIERINELYRKSKSSVGLTPAEKSEQAKLRREYIAAMRANLRGSLETIKIQNPDGTVIDVKRAP
ncbi:hypothetical protein P261_00689 [Lachnospiraceae bacterium TWA4]|nr:hypothetical protein P261_00689 [Lachnospiraceae bacterium TWA4]